jgi:hypothetical protein
MRVAEVGHWAARFNQYVLKHRYLLTLLNPFIIYRVLKHILNPLLIY